MPKPFFEIITGRAPKLDATFDAEIIGGSDASYTVRTDKGISLSGIANGTTAKFRSGETVTILYPGGDGGRARIIGRVTRKKAAAKTVVV